MIRQPPNPSIGLRFLLDPRVYFAFFLVMNSLLAYSTDSLSITFWGGCLGALVPLALILFLKRNVRGDREPLWEKEVVSMPMERWALFLLSSVVVSRLAGLTSLSAWPMPDDATFAYYSVELSQRWSWRFFFTQAQAPPLFNWCMAFFYRLSAPGLFSLWLFPALVSILTFAAGAWGVRKYFSRSFSFLFLSVGALDFWLQYTGRFCMPTGFCLFWEILALTLLAHFLKAPAGQNRKYAAFALGLCLGLGFFVSPLWILLGL